MEGRGGVRGGDGFFLCEGLGFGLGLGWVLIADVICESWEVERIGWNVSCVKQFRRRKALKLRREVEVTPTNSQAPHSKDAQSPVHSVLSSWCGVVWCVLDTALRLPPRPPAPAAPACPQVCARSTRYLFDGMPKKTEASDKDRFGDLTDDLLRHVLSFLPPEDVLQTCVLDTRWRDHWRRTTNLVHDFEESGFPSPERFKQLVKLFSHLRGNSPLDKYEIYACRDDEDGLDHTYTNTLLLVQYALKCQVKELLIWADYLEDDPPVFNVPLISQRLKTIHLEQVNLEHTTLDFSRCPVLEDLKMHHCRIHARRVSSKSLKRLCITYFCSFSWHFHTRIFAPALTELQLDDFEGFPPFLEYMPFLVTAYVGLQDECPNFCHVNHYCGCHAYPLEEAVFLNGLSNAVNLELIAEPEMAVQFIYRWNLEWCPIFDKLKTLLLNDWFRAIDLVCILQHSSS